MTAITVTPLAVDGTGDKALPTTNAKRGLRGAFLNIPHIGPVITTATATYDANPTLVHPTYATTLIGAGGVEDTTGYRDDDSYDPTGNSGGLAGGPTTSVTRPTGRTAFIGAGVPGGSTVSDKDTGGSEAGEVIDVAGRAQSTGKDRFGRTKGTANSGAGLGDLVYTNFDGRATLDGDGGRSIGSAGRDTQTDPDAVGSNVNVVIARPSTGTSADPSAGTVGVVDGGAGGVVRVDIHADDITGGANGLAGYNIILRKRDSGDTDEDGALIGSYDCDGGTDITTVLTDATLAGTTIVFYARKRYPVQKFIAARTGPGVVNQGAVATGITKYGYGPLSARATLAVT